MTLLHTLEPLLPLVSEHALANERNRAIAPEVVAALVPTGVFRMWLPAVYGGPEIDPLTASAAVSMLAEADAATAWCTAIASQTAHAAGVLDADGVREVWGDPSTIACGAFAPNGRAVGVDGGYSVTGSWAWGSGSGHSQFMTGGSFDDSGAPCLLFLRTDDLEFRDTWYSSGLRGTGSNDFDANGVFVPSSRCLRLGSRPIVDSPIAHLSMYVLFSAGIASVMIGIARRSIRELIDLADSKKPMGSSKTLASSSIVQANIARAEAMVRSSSGYLHDEVARCWEMVLRGDRVPVEDRVRVRLAASHVADECCRAVDLMYAAGGGSAVYERSPLQRCFRDVHTAAAHVVVSDRGYETVGRFRLGLEINTASI